MKIQILALNSNRNKNVTGLKRLMGSKPSLDNWISKGNTDIR